MSKIAAFLELLKDSKWHEKTELQKILEFDEQQIQEIMAFLIEYNLVEMDHKKEKVRLNKDFRKILVQPTRQKDLKLEKNRVYEKSNFI